MARRTLKSLRRKAKSGQFDPRTAYVRDAATTKSAVRSSLVGARSARTAARSEPVPPRNRQSVPATQAKNRFGEILQTARDSGPVFIERHGQTQAVVLGIEAYNKLTSGERSSQERELDYWTRQFDALHARMQTHKARQAVDALFSATDAELNRRDA
jgi:prevent-host-death family protein